MTLFFLPFERIFPLQFTFIPTRSLILFLQYLKSYNSSTRPQHHHHHSVAAYRSLTPPPSYPAVLVAATSWPGLWRSAETPRTGRPVEPARDSTAAREPPAPCVRHPSYEWSTTATRTAARTLRERHGARDGRAKVPVLC
jgi:hypothetical protein